MNIIQQKMTIFRVTDRIIDACLLFFSALIALRVEQIYQTIVLNAQDISSLNFYAIMGLICIWLILIHIIENNLVYRQTSFWKIFQNIALITIMGITSSITVDFLLKTGYLNRSIILLFCFFSFISLMLKRGWLKYFLSSIREEGLDPKNILIIGSQKRAERLILEFLEHTEYGLRIRSILDPDSTRAGESVGGLVVEGDMSLFKKNIKDLKIDEVFFALDMNLIPDINNIFIYLDTLGVSYHMMMSESIHSYIDKIHDIEPITSSYCGIPMFSFQAVSANHIKIFIKNSIEKAITFILLLFSFPIFILFSILVKFTSKGPVFISQELVGLHGRKFYQYKLRSNILAAESVMDNNTHLIEPNKPIPSLKYDHQLTKVGKFIRQYSIDEFPQLFNVLKGDMTLIGPHPPFPYQVQEYNDMQLRRLSMKPGITGLWQINNRNKEKDIDQGIKIDLEYIDNWNFLMDYKIALKTVRTVLSGTGI